MRALYQRSGGVPRLINIIADRALVSAYARESGNVTPAMVHAAANEVQPSETKVRSNRWPLAVATVSVALLVVLSVVMWGSPVLDGFRPVAVEESLEIAKSDAIPEPVIPAPEEVQQVEQAREDLPVGAYTAELVTAPETLSGIDPDWLEDQNQLVWQLIAKLWQDGNSANAILSACNGVSGTGYACLSDQGNWSRIRKLGLPVILVLHDDSSNFLVLRGFSQDGLLVGSGDNVIEVSRDAVEAQWLGEYIVAWPQAPDWPGQIRRGESGAAVDIVMDMAGLAEPAWSGAGIFDAEFESWLMTFQRQRGLKADGIVGPNTLIYLMAPTITQPRLILASVNRP
jgi:general secretion pathway protein A